MLQAMQTIHRRSKGLLGFVENYRRLTRLPCSPSARVYQFGSCLLICRNSFQTKRFILNFHLQRKY